MELITRKFIEESINGTVLKKGKSDIFKDVVIDSRKVTKGSIFFALSGENVDGNSYVEKASKNGASLCIIDKVSFNESEISEETTIILVKDSVIAIGILASRYREMLGVRVIGITGSCGKTSTKDLVGSVLSQKYKIIKTEGNFNNHLGVPLMIFKLDKNTEIAILEMGMSAPNEIDYLQKIAKPEVAIITNIGVSHIENFENQKGIYDAKLEITNGFNKENTLIINGYDEILSTFSSNKFKVLNTKNSFEVKDVVLGDSKISFNIKYDGKAENFEVDSPGKHTLYNALLAIATGIIFDVDFESINKGLKNILKTSSRLDIKEILGIKVIDDSYNASPDSMKSALDVLNLQSGKRKFAILGTMNELGSNTGKYSKEIGEYASKIKGINLLVYSDYSKEYEEGFKGEKFISFNSKEDIVKYIKKNVKKEDVILVKASRSHKFEEIVQEIYKINIPHEEVSSKINN